jgi:hypothetical protein
LFEEDWLTIAISPFWFNTILGPMPQPKSTFNLPLTSKNVFNPTSVFVNTNDFYLAVQEIT